LIFVPLAASLARRTFARCALGAALLTARAPVGAQQVDTAAPRRVSGRIIRGTRDGPVAIARSWVVLHRVGPDRAGPLDSMRTTATGGFEFRYRASGNPDAIYFVSTQYGGIAYFSSALRLPVVSGDDAMITVFDTTSGPVAIKLAGRHFIVGAPQPGARRPVGEVLDLENDSTVTRVGGTANPTWTAHTPSGAVSFELNPDGDIAASAVSRRSSDIELFAPLAPGIRQLAFTYQLPPGAFPLVVPVERSTGLLEVLVQEPSARVTGAGLAEVAPVTTEGRTFRRFLAQDVAANAIARIEIPMVVGASRLKFYFAFAVAVLVAMSAALVIASQRRGPRRAASRADRGGPRHSSSILADIAALDDAFERRTDSSDGDRAQYQSRRATLKGELAAVLAGERRLS
jgi:hypothetical protein